MNSLMPDVIFVGVPLRHYRTNRDYDSNYPYVGLVTQTGGDFYVFFEAATVEAAAEVQNTQSVSIDVRWRRTKGQPRHWLSRPYLFFEQIYTVSRITATTAVIRFSIFSRDAIKGLTVNGII